jgi:hypothetical protein
MRLPTPLHHTTQKNTPTLLVFTPFFVSLQHADQQPFYHRNRGTFSEKSLRPFDGEAVKPSSTIIVIHHSNNSSLAK